MLLYNIGIIKVSSGINLLALLFFTGDVINAITGKKINNDDIEELISKNKTECKFTAKIPEGLI
jgi:hypothetical protein